MSNRTERWRRPCCQASLGRWCHAYTRRSTTAAARQPKNSNRSATSTKWGNCSRKSPGGRMASDSTVVGGVVAVGGSGDRSQIDGGARSANCTCPEVATAAKRTATTVPVSRAAPALCATAAGYLAVSSTSNDTTSRYASRLDQSSAGGSHSSIALPSRSWMRANRPTDGSFHSGFVVMSMPAAPSCSSNASRSRTRRLSMNCLSAGK